MGYNQHQSFYLRDRWLSKAIRGIDSNPSFFFEKDAFEKVGLGKNMVQSLRHWIKATKVVDEFSREKIHTYTKLGLEIKRFDPLIVYFGTTAILHYNITSNIEPSTAWYWFFNIYEETVSSKESIFEEFQRWVQRKENRAVSSNSLKRDIECLIKMYTFGVNVEDPEEVTSSPFYKLGLLEEKNGVIYKKELSIPDEHREFLLFILISYCHEKGIFELSLNDILNKEGLFGKTFNLSRSSVVKLLVEFTNHPRHPIIFTRTNNLDMVQVQKIDPIKFIREEYFERVDEYVGTFS